MTQEQKDLLLKDLCARLPYGVKCEIKGYKEVYTLNRIEIDYENGHLFDFKEQKNGFNMQVYSSEVKPYLFPMSSMTKKQESEYDDLDFNPLYDAMEHKYNGIEEYMQLISKSKIDPIQWCYKNHFDCRGLIEKGLAIDATNLNIY